MTADRDTQLALYETLARSRAFEESVSAWHDHYHQATGEEAVIVGAFHGLRPTDTAVSHYRGSLIGGLVMGAEARRLIAGIQSKETAYDRGRFRSELRPPPELGMFGVMGGSIGPSICYGTGAGLAAKLRGTDDVAVVLFGDGASGRGEFHESINMAAIMDLPVVYVCQNNQYCVDTPLRESVAGSIADRAVGYGIPGAQVDGNDVLAVYTAVQEAVARARAGEGPTLLDALTYRVMGHQVYDPAPYQPEDERAPWRERDPLDNFEKKLIAEGVLGAEAAEEIRAAAAEEMTRATQQVEQDPPPGAADADPTTVFAD